VLPLAVITTSNRATVLERLKEIPADFWLRAGVAVVALVALVIVLRKVAKMNKVVLAAVVFLVSTVVGFNWIYERNEPAWATPVIGFLATFMPTKGPVAKTTPPPVAAKR
jgi:hypothetical protein